MLTPGNTKLGKIHNWSIPAIKTCPGSSEACRSVCYAAKGYYCYASTREAHNSNYRLTRRAEFPFRLMEQIESENIRTVRIHAAGDFYSTAYVDDWRNIVQACRQTIFYAYTRSWRVKAFISSLTALGNEPNMHLWLSDDRGMPVPPAVPGARIAYLANDDDDTPNYPVDLVFRNTRQRDLPVLKRIGPFQSQVCPVEQGVEKNKDMTCEICRICFTEPRQLVQLKVA